MILPIQISVTYLTRHLRDVGRNCRGEPWNVDWTIWAANLNLNNRWCRDCVEFQRGRSSSSYSSPPAYLPVPTWSDWCINLYFGLLLTACVSVSSAISVFLGSFSGLSFTYNRSLIWMLVLDLISGSEGFKGELQDMFKWTGSAKIPLKLSNYSKQYFDT